MKKFNSSPQLIYTLFLSVLFCFNFITCNKGVTSNPPPNPDTEETPGGQGGRQGGRDNDTDTNPPTEPPESEISSVESEPLNVETGLGDYPESGPGGLMQAGAVNTCFNAAGTQLVAFVPGFASGFFNFETVLAQKKERIRRLEAKRKEIEERLEKEEKGSERYQKLEKKLGRVIDARSSLPSKVEMENEDNMRKVSNLAKKVITMIRKGEAPDEITLTEFYNAVRNSQGSWTDEEGRQGDVSEYLTALLNLGFPNKQVKVVNETKWTKDGVPQSRLKHNPALALFKVPMIDGEASKSMTELVNRESVVQNISDYKPYKSDGDERVFPATRKQLFFKPPKTLTLSLKRFVSSFETGGVDSKIETRVKNPLQFTLRRESIYQGTSDITYNANAIIEHRGGSGGGHYVAYIKHPSGKWIECNDSIVRPITHNEAKTAGETAYIISYVRN